MKRLPGAVLVVAVALAPATVAAGAAAPVVPRGAVAVAGGAEITRATFDHWLLIAVKGESSSNPRAPIVVPSDPPGFRRCVRSVRQEIPRLRQKPARTLQRRCARMFSALKAQALDVLIRAHWYEAQAAADQIVITRAQVRHEFAVDKRGNFSTAKAFRSFLRATGQTSGDILFRVRINLILTALLKRSGGHIAALEALIKRRFRPLTSCARYYRMFDCAPRRAI